MVYFKLNIKNINNYLLTIIIPTTINIIPSISFFENFSLKYIFATITPNITDKPFIMAYTIPAFIFCND